MCPGGTQGCPGTFVPKIIIQFFFNFLKRGLHAQVLFYVFFSLNINSLWKESDNTAKRNERKVQVIEGKKTEKVATTRVGRKSERKANVVRLLGGSVC